MPQRFMKETFARLVQFTLVSRLKSTAFTKFPSCLLCFSCVRLGIHGLILACYEAGRSDCITTSFKHKMIYIFQPPSDVITPCKILVITVVSPKQPRVNADQS